MSPGPPESAGFDVPGPMRRLAGPLRPVPVWRNNDGVLTCALHDDDAKPPLLYLKWAAPGTVECFQDEAERLAWAGRYTPVPKVVEVGADDEGRWLLTEAIDAESAVSRRWRADPATAVRAIGEGLRSMHEALPVAGCPFSWSVESRRQRAQAVFESGYSYPPSAFKQDRHGLTPLEALHRLREVPPVDHLVVCHADPCSPNTLLDGNGHWRAHVDLGHMGVADRWADLAVASWSCEWNYGRRWGTALLEAYGVAPDEERTYFYRLLWDMA